MTRKLNKFDLRLLDKIRLAGHWFDDGRSNRPFTLEQLGLLEGTLKLRRMTSDNTSTRESYSKAYSITAAGLAALAAARPEETKEAS